MGKPNPKRKPAKSKGTAASVKQADGRPDTKRSKVMKRQKKKPTIALLTKKQRREVRRKQRDDYGLVMDAKLIWEQLRRHNATAQQRGQLMDQMMALVTGHIHEMSVKHDAARSIQCCLHYGSRQQRTVIFNELKDHIVELSKLKYAKFTVKSLMKYCIPEQRNEIISALYGHVRRLVQHTEAAEIVETAYNDYANAHQRNALVQEFYGPQFALFKSELGSSLEEILKSSPDQKPNIIKHMKSSLTTLIDKSLLKHTIVHRVLLEFFLHADDTSRAEMIESLREHVIHVVHTKEGSRTALQCLWHGTPKDRKVIVKSFKGYVSEVCMKENAHVVMMAILDCVDDTILVRKSLLTEMCKQLDQLCDNHFGRRVLLYLLSPRNRQHFTPQFIDILTPGDGNPHSKKPAEVRYKELLDGISGPLLDLARQKAVEWAKSTQHAVLLIQIAISVKGDLTPLFEPLVDSLSQEFVPASGDHLVDHSCGHWVMKRLLAVDSQWTTTEQGQEHLAAMMVDRIPPSQFTSWTATNRGSFVVCSLLESRVTGIEECVREMLVGTCDTLGSSPGQQALQKILATS